MERCYCNYVSYDTFGGRWGRLARGVSHIHFSSGETVMARKLGIAIFALTLAALVNVAQAAEDPTGTWKWSVTRGDQTFDVTLKLKLEGDKLTGTMPGRNNTETAIEEGTFKDNVVAFKVTRERNGQKFTTKYSGTVSGDEIKGKSTSERDGKVTDRDWVAKRSK